MDFLEVPFNQTQIGQYDFIPMPHPEQYIKKFGENYRIDISQHFIDLLTAPRAPRLFYSSKPA